MNKAQLKQNIKNWWNEGTDTQNIVPAAFFTRSSSAELPQVYLFAQFGLAQGADIGQQSQITTHYTEQNNHVNDHWALNPLTYSLKGLIGELIYSAPTKWANASPYANSAVYDILSIISPTMDNATRSAYNIYQHTEAVADRYRQQVRTALSNIGVIKTQTQQTNQQYVFTQVQSLQLNRQLVQILTPYGWFENMAITNVRMSQNNQRFVSEIVIDFQEWRNVGELAQRAATKQEKAQMAILQQSVEQNNGQASTSQVSNTDRDSWLFTATGRPQYLIPYKRQF